MPSALLATTAKTLYIQTVSENNTFPTGKGATSLDDDAFDDLDEVLGAMGIKAKVRALTFFYRNCNDDDGRENTQYNVI